VFRRNGTDQTTPSRFRCHLSDCVSVLYGSNAFWKVDASGSCSRYSCRRVTESVLIDKSISGILLLGTRKSLVKRIWESPILEVKSPI